MADYTITITLTDAQDSAMKNIATKAGKTVAQIFQEFWDGYSVDGKVQVGAVKSQINQWINDDLKTELAKTTPENVLALLK